jgi:Raf kinase inhibitor-like YbhB/YbcL family protein
MSFTLSSPSFPPNGQIPSRFTCDADDVAPALAWSGAPAATKSYALLVDDPDAPDPTAPKMVYVHWVLYDIPATVTSLPEGASTATLPRGTKEGLNDWHRTGYGGPCPPVGRHRYFFKLYALDALLGDRGELQKPDLLRLMEPHVLASAEVMGTYARTGKKKR